MGIGFVFLFFFAVVIIIQVIGMLFHRWETLSHIIPAQTPVRRYSVPISLWLHERSHLSFSKTEIKYDFYRHTPLSRYLLQSHSMILLNYSGLILLEMRLTSTQHSMISQV